MLAYKPGQLEPTFEPDEWDCDRGGYYRLEPAKDRSCLRCPFLVENFEKVGEPPLENPGTYLPSTRSDLWHFGVRQDGVALGDERLDPGPETDGVRGGGEMICHIRRQDFPPHRAYLGSPAQRHWRTIVCGCTSTLVLQQRELLRYVEHGPTASGLTWQGACDVAAGMLGRDVTGEEVRDTLTVRDLLPHTHPALLDERIGFEDVTPLSDAELRDWARG